MDWTLMSALVESVVRFCVKVYRQDLQDKFSLFITDTPVEPSFRGTVYEKCLILTWDALDFRKEFCESHRGMFMGRIHWEELYEGLPGKNITVYRYSTIWKCHVSLPCPGQAPKLYDYTSQTVPTLYWRP